jgi:hypothetical protein
VEVQRLDTSLHAALRARAAQAELPSVPEAAAIAPALLPLFLDWVGFIGLREDGELLFVSWDPPHDGEIVQEAHLRRTALVAGAEKYPELSTLIPRRPSEAELCTFCGGSGRPILLGGVVPENVRCVCGGLGWLLPGERQQLSRP